MLGRKEITDAISYWNWAWIVIIDVRGMLESHLELRIAGLREFAGRGSAPYSYDQLFSSWRQFGTINGIASGECV